VSDRWERIGVPAGLAMDVHGQSFDPSRQVVMEATRFVGDGDTRRLCVLAGPPGTGKSVAAAYAVLQAKTADKVVSYLDSRDGSIGSAVLDGAPPGARWVQARALWTGVFDRPLWEAAGRVSLLVIDDLGAEPADDKVTPLIASVLCERVDARRKTIVTTNMDPNLIHRRYGGRLADRLDAWFGAVGPSLRGRAAI
jgi:DNA replication protein DnaC